MAKGRTIRFRRWGFAWKKNSVKKPSKTLIRIVSLFFTTRVFVLFCFVLFNRFRFAWSSVHSFDRGSSVVLFFLFFLFSFCSFFFTRVSLERRDANGIRPRRHQKGRSRRRDAVSFDHGETPSREKQNLKENPPPKKKLTRPTTRVKKNKNQNSVMT